MTETPKDSRLTVEQSIKQAFDCSMVTRWAVVAETVDEDGSVSIGTFLSPGLPLYVASGMLRWSADTMGGMPVYARVLYADEEEFEDEDEDGESGTLF